MKCKIRTAFGDNGPIQVCDTHYLKFDIAAHTPIGVCPFAELEKRVEKLEKKIECLEPTDGWGHK